MEEAMNIYDFKRRIEKLENKLGTHREGKAECLLRCLLEDGYEAVAAQLAEVGSRPLPFWVWMNLMDDTSDAIAFERYRELVPDDVIRRAYSHRRNYVYGDAATVLRIRQLAGVLDDDGNVLPCYVMLENGCIVDAPVAMVK